MSNPDSPFQVSIPIVGITNGFEKTYKTGVVSRVYATGNFLIDWEGECQPNPQQWRPSPGVLPIASKTGDVGRSGGWRNRTIVYILDEKMCDKINHCKRAVTVRDRLHKVQSDVAKLVIDPDSVSEAALKDMLRVVNLIESAVR